MPKPRVRSVDGGELELPHWRHFSQEDPLDERVQTITIKSEITTQPLQDREVVRQEEADHRQHYDAAIKATGNDKLDQKVKQAATDAASKGQQKGWSKAKTDVKVKKAAEKIINKAAKQIEKAAKKLIKQYHKQHR